MQVLFALQNMDSLTKGVVKLSNIDYLLQLLNV